MSLIGRTDSAKRSLRMAIPLLVLTSLSRIVHMSLGMAFSSLVYKIVSIDVDEESTVSISLVLQGASKE